MDLDSPLFHTKGSLQLDLEQAGRRWPVSLGQEVWCCLKRGAVGGALISRPVISNVGMGR
jgi:hypothetical protein